MKLEEFKFPEVTGADLTTIPELLEEAEKRLKAKGVEFIWCNARVVALDFYLKMGYEIYGSVFELPEIGPHYRMYKRL